MTDPATPVVLRPMTRADVPLVLDVQQPGAVLGLAAVFAQETHPFPREVIAERWEREIADPAIECLVVTLDGVVVGFAAERDDELLHLGTAVEHWGTGLAQAALDAVLDRMRARGVRRVWARVFAANDRGRRFYATAGWTATGSTSRSTFAPYAELLEIELDLAPG